MTDRTNPASHLQHCWITIPPLKQHRDNYLFSWIDGQTPRAPDLVETRRNGFAPVSVPDTLFRVKKSSYSCLASSSFRSVGRPFRWSAFVPTTPSVSIAVMVLLPTTFTITIITKMPLTRNKGVSTREESLHDNVTDNNNSERWRLSLHCFSYLPRRCRWIESSR